MIKVKLFASSNLIYHHDHPLFFFLETNKHTSILDIMFKAKQLSSQNHKTEKEEEDNGEDGKFLLVLEKFYCPSLALVFLTLVDL
jgi:hypothetical protein